jgi:hypothetical protein
MRWERASTTTRSSSEKSYHWPYGDHRTIPWTSTSSRTRFAPEAFAAARRRSRSASGVQQVWIIECD